MNAKQIADKLREADKIVFFHHVLPDGDSLSSSYALVKSIQHKFPNKIVKWVADVPFIEKRFPYLNITFDDVIDGSEVDQSWTSIVGDNAVLERIFGNEVYQKAGTKLCFDHHRNVINFEHDVYWQQSDLGASAIQAFMIAKELGIEYDSHRAILALFGILTDTGNFTYSLADPRPLEAAAELMHFIDDKDLDRLYQAMNKKTKKDIAIQAYALNNHFIEDGVAYVKWTHETQQELGIDPNDCARVNLISNMEGAKVWIFFIEYREENYIRIEFRSSGVPVNEVAIKFGGGGHLRASGAKLTEWPTHLEVIQEAQKAIKAFED